MLLQMDSITELPVNRNRAAEVLEAGNLLPVDWEGWLRIDDAERDLGVRHGRDRVKIQDREELVRIGTNPVVHAE